MMGISKSEDLFAFRCEAIPADVGNVRRLVTDTGFFHEGEIEVAAELVTERLAKGEASGYFFVFAEHGGRLAGYTCFGPIPCTQSAFDLYWIAVHPDFQGKGLGRRLSDESERQIREAGGTRIYADTSSRPQYASTRAFYEHCGYRRDAVLEDFYAPGDGKVIYRKLM